MFNIEIADMVIGIDNKYQLLKDKCADYITDKENNTGIILSATEERIQWSIDFKKEHDGEIIDLPYAECDGIHYALYEQLYKYDAFWLHSVLIEKDGYGYAFSAAPGVGKSTHAQQWLNAFNDVRIVNGDNTIIRLDKESGIYYGYGTPFCGKEGYQVNTKVPIGAVCFIERSDTNFVIETDEETAFKKMKAENFCFGSNPLVNTAIYLRFAASTKFYTVHCDMTPNAAITAYNAIKH